MQQIKSFLLQYGIAWPGGGWSKIVLCKLRKMDNRIENLAPARIWRYIPYCLGPFCAGLAEEYHPLVSEV